MSIPKRLLFAGRYYAKGMTSHHEWKEIRIIEWIEKGRCRNPANDELCYTIVRSENENSIGISNLVTVKSFAAWVDTEVEKSIKFVIIDRSGDAAPTPEPVLQIRQVDKV